MAPILMHLNEANEDGTMEDSPMMMMGALAVSGAAAAIALYVSTRTRAIEPPVDLNNQSVEIPNSGHARASRFVPEGKLIDYLYPGTETLLEVMQRGERISGNGPCLGCRSGIDGSYKWITYQQTLERSKNFGAGLLNIGLKPGQSTFIGIYSQNSVEWILTEQSCYHYSEVIVPLYDTLGPHACTYIINQAEITAVVCDTEEKVKSLLAESSRCPTLKHIVVIKSISEDTKKRAQECGVSLYSYSEIEELGKSNPHQTMPCKTADLATVCYTSGTTGNPKGVMLTHANIITDVCAVVHQLREYAPGPTDVMMSFLPLAHMLERLCETSVYINGGCVGFYGGDIKLLGDDMKALRPTITPTVPRLLNRIYDKVQAGVSGSKLKKWLLNRAIQSKQAEIERQIIRNNGIWDKIVFRQVREGMGGRLRLLVSGSAPIAANVLTFFRCALGCMVVEGYGQTECVAPATLSIQGESTAGHVGPPIPCCTIKLVDVPEMDYYAKNGQGEVWIKGHNVFKGYLKDPEKTAETLDSSGWLHTGDIGMWLPNGALKIVDRKKHIFKLAQGEYIAPEKIENIYLASSYVAQIFVHGESLQSCLVGIIIPDKEVLMEWCDKKRIKDTWTNICQNKVVKKMILDDLSAIGRKAGLKSFEQLKDAYIHDDAFTIENDLLTPTMKTKRPECRKLFMPQIEAMYRLLA